MLGFCDLDKKQEGFWQTYLKAMDWGASNQVELSESESDMCKCVAVGLQDQDFKKLETGIWRKDSE